MRFVCAGKEWDLLQNTQSGFICCPGGFSEGFPLPPSTLCSWVSLGSRKVGVFRALMH